MSTTHKRRRTTPILWAGGAVAALALVLGVNGTLASWSTAIINNSNNTVGSATAVTLQEFTGPTPTGTPVCDTATDLTGANSDLTCTGVNKYGGDTVDAFDQNPLTPGAVTATPASARTQTVTLRNNGTGSAALTLTPAACVSVANQKPAGTPVAGADPTTYPICNKMEVTVSCTITAGGTAGTPTTVQAATTLSAFSGVKTIGTLGSGDYATCSFTVNLPTNTPSGYSGQVAQQQLKWTLA